MHLKGDLGGERGLAEHAVRRQRLLVVGLTPGFSVSSPAGLQRRCCLIAQWQTLVSDLLPSLDWRRSTGIVSFSESQGGEEEERQKRRSCAARRCLLYGCSDMPCNPSTVPLIFGTRDQGRSVNRFSLYITTFESECCTTSCATPELHMRCRSSRELPGLCHLACLYLPGSLAVSTLFARLVFTRVCVCRICKCRKEKSNLLPEPALIYIDILPVPSASMFAPGRPPFLSHVASSRPFSWILVASLTYLVSGNRLSVIFGA